MADIKILDFAKNVEQNRQSLIAHCKENGKEADNSLSLSQIVGINNTINQEQQGGFEGRWIDIDGTILKKEYVQDGGSFSPPTNPSFDSEYLEFVEWVSARDYTDVHSDIDMGASYKSKIDENGRRNTYLVCYFNSTTGLNPTITIYKSTSSSTAYVDWGDGTTNNYSNSSSVTASHTYESEGKYVIKIWCDGLYYICGGSGSTSILGSKNLSNALLRLYIGENYQNIYPGLLYELENVEVLNIPNDIQNKSMPGYITYRCYSLKCGIIPNSVTRLSDQSSGTSGLFNQSYALKHLILPSSLNYIGRSLCNTCYTLDKVILPISVETFYTINAFQQTTSLRKVVLPNNITTFGNSMFYESGINYITIPSSVVSIESGAFQRSNIKAISIPSSVASISSAFGGTYLLKEIDLGMGFNGNASFSTSYNNLSLTSLINIAKALKDNAGTGTTNTITFSRYAKNLFELTYLNELGEQVEYKTDGAVSLLQFITNKNWTVAFS